jgi:hypothetical protein
VQMTCAGQYFSAAEPYPPLFCCSLWQRNSRGILSLHWVATACTCLPEGMTATHRWAPDKHLMLPDTQA